MIENINKFCFIRLLVVVVCVLMVGCGKIIVNTDWSEFLHEVGHGFAHANCQKDRNIDSADYYECIKEVETTHDDLEIYRQIKKQESAIELSQCDTAVISKSMVRLDNQKTTLNHDGSCEPTLDTRFNFHE
ncbi:hypothetical protein JYT79_02305 [Cardiobacterium sp. AH-315-I02]|nr:hypothetical protein [Cardiobacterium sp. AH-315-I02]